MRNTPASGEEPETGVFYTSVKTRSNPGNRLLRKQRPVKASACRQHIGTDPKLPDAERAEHRSKIRQKGEIKIQKR